ncbi:putative reverse transcriptase domain-containing protein [Tanacetum coccineum]|uniref:Reverse transcriptase domain-containing protein n=1 Tax=Tanacetum coccineum TaxID=301880 RepID=A0ABQ5C795_9ASTR
MAPKRATRSTPVTTTPAPTAATTTTVTNAQLQAMIDQGVSAALAARDATRNGVDSHTSGTGVRGSERVARECTYQDFMKCKPLYFKGTEGVVELTQWFERMETVFRISNCSVENQIKFSTCTLLAGALTWWNSHVMTVTHDVAYAMTWVDLRKKMTDKYCPRNEMKKLEAELWNLKVIGTDVVKYNQRFQELALLCVRMFLEESDKIERQAENKRKFENTSRNNQNQQQQQNKRQNTGRAYTAGSGDKKQYGGSRPLCSKCNYHHDGPCAPKCSNCKRVGHLAKDCRSRPANANNNNCNNNNNNQKGNGCYECGAQGHFRRNCPKLRNNDRGNQAGNDRAPAKVYVVGNAGANPDNVVAGTFLLNNRYAYILFDTGADRSFVSTAFSSQIDITPSTLDHYYDVELADGRIIGLNTILKGDGSTQGNVTRLNIISCTKTQKYMEKGFPIFLAHVTAKEVEDKSKKKRLEDVPIVQDFPEVFPEDLSGPSTTHKKQAFQLLEQKVVQCTNFLQNIILALPEGSEDFIAYCDASKKGLGAVLMQREKVFPHLKFEATYLYEPSARSSLIIRAYNNILIRKELNNEQRRWKERDQPLRVRALVMTISLDLPKQILNAQTKHKTRELSRIEYFVEEPVEIVGREVKRLKRSRIPLVKVRWNSKRGPEFTWEREDQFEKKYPHLFTKTTSSSSAAS